MLDTPSRRQAMLNTIGMVVLVLGLVAASLVLLRGLRQSNNPATSNSHDNWQDDTLSIRIRRLPLTRLKSTTANWAC